MLQHLRNPIRELISDSFHNLQSNLSGNLVPFSVKEGQRFESIECNQIKDSCSNCVTLMAPLMKTSRESECPTTSGVDTARNWTRHATGVKPETISIEYSSSCRTLLQCGQSYSNGVFSLCFTSVVVGCEYRN